MAYQSEVADAELGCVADAARAPADSAGAAIDDALAFIATSNRRIAGMEAAKPAWLAVTTPRRRFVR